ncbi:MULTISPECIES: hypothetical protein [Acetobacter]|uniref:hypothetical protein n=1 Tax=Acetobacter TaxID=434 RepID=UPI000A3CA8B3|nr:MULTISPECIES: hypothetical protein [Acetobacter]MBS0981302.1 hypothetical protein [Acetobacter thailandicus]MBS0985884.1 hypothetical protein [Acetobacter thailandicus]MBS1004461.1 hypothetical protein [Acetobacter thailandicus]OUI89068.1 hypothetical protein HK11_02150 [Acetobacter sp. DmW_043]OUJ11011.1 hypothetical protein HK25_03130 [Acetobacter sp. DsW_059]
MSAIKRLWNRAPLWRTALLTACLCTLLSLIFPAPWLVQIAPPYKVLTSKIGHTLGSDTSSFQDADSSGQPDQAAAEHHTASAPPFDAEFTGVIPFAGRQLPLPAGKWHAIANQQDDQNHSEVLSSVLVRVDQGLVTGLIVAQATTQPVSAENAQNLESLCNNGYNFLVGSLPQDGRQTECWMTSPVRVLDHSFMAANQPLQGLMASPILAFTLNRLTEMKFILPPAMVDAAWLHIEKTKSGSGVDVASVHTLISPATPGQKNFPGAPEDWTRTGMQNDPAVASFVNSVNVWLVKWLPYLRKAYANKLEANTIPATIAADPGYHN